MASHPVVLVGGPEDGRAEHLDEPLPHALCTADGEELRHLEDDCGCPAYHYRMSHARADGVIEYAVVDPRAEPLRPPG